MRHLFAIITCALLAQGAAAQTAKGPLDPLTYRKGLGTIFTSLITGEAKPKIGNFATADIKEAQVSFNGCQVFKNYSVLAINANAGISDGVASIFTNSKLNSNVGIDLRYSFIFTDANGYIRHSHVDYDVAFRDDYDADVVLAGSSFANMGRELRRQDSLLQIDYRRSNYKIKALEETIAALGHKPGRETRQRNDADNNKLDSLVAERIKLSSKIEQLNISLQANAAKLDKLIEGLDDKKSDSLDELRAQLFKGLSGYKLNWFSLHYKVLDNAFRTFDPSLAYNEQVQKRNFVTHTAGIEFNIYNWSEFPFRSYYLQAGAEGFLTDNKGELQSLQLSETTQYGATAGERLSSKQYNVYTGKYETNITGAHLYLDFYYFLFKKNLAAIHVYPEAVYKSSAFPSYNTGLGFLYTFKDKKDATGKSLVNVELYIKFSDIFNVNSAANNFYERNDIGLRFAIPIKFVTK